MRKLILQMNTTLDGFVGGPNGELDWMVSDADPKQLELLDKLTSRIDTIIMGRKMAPGFTKYWEDVLDNHSESPEHPYAKIFVETPKIVFSKTVDKLPGRNVTVENRDLVESISRLKATKGKDMIVYGGANFVSQLVKYDLIDEMHLLINPAVLGSGLKAFSDFRELELKDSIVCRSGIVINSYTKA